MASDRAQLNQRIQWMRSGTDLFAATLAVLPDPELDEPSLLPGWDRRHVLGHLARNADALINLLDWARTGIETPMYPSRQAREAGIEEAAEQPAAALRNDVRDTIDRLDRAIEAMPDDAWQGMIRTARGRPVTGAEVPWMRVREVWVHAVDLAAGARFADIPAEVGAALLVDAFGFAAGQADAPAVLVQASDAPVKLRLGDDDPVVVHAPLSELLPWALGRSAARTATSRDWPELPPWL